MIEKKKKKCFSRESEILTLAEDLPAGSRHTWDWLHVLTAAANVLMDAKLTRCHARAAGDGERLERVRPPGERRGLAEGGPAGSDEPRRSLSGLRLSPAPLRTRPPGDPPPSFMPVFFLWAARESPDEEGAVEDRGRHRGPQHKQSQLPSHHLLRHQPRSVGGGARSGMHTTWSAHVVQAKWSHCSIPSLEHLNVY